MGGILCFLLGLTVGTLFGVLLMACLQISRVNEEYERRFGSTENRR